MAVYVKYDCFLKDVHEKKHNMAADAIKVVLTNRAPVVATDRVLADIVEIAAGNGYTAGGNAATLTSSSQTAGVYKLILVSPAVWTASGGVIGPFRYAVLHNSTANLVIAYHDYGSSISINIGETFTETLDGTNGVYTNT